MKLFESFRKGKSQESIPENWNMQDVPFAGDSEASNPRQQRKIVAYFVSGNTNVIGDYDVPLADGAEDFVYKRFLNGEIGTPEKKQFLQCIASPESLEGPEAVFDKRVKEANENSPSFQHDKHLRRILAYYSGVGFNNPQLVRPKDLTTFWQRYETPVDFEEAGDKLLDSIKEANSEQKYNEYQQAMRDFKALVFGKRQEYWDQIKLMEKAARSSRSALGETSFKGELEPLIKEVGGVVIAKHQLDNGIENLQILEDDGSSQDSILSLPEKGLFGVFDGVGGSSGGRKASQIAVKKVEELSDLPVNGSDDLKMMLNEASDAISGNEKAGQSTGVLAKVIEKDGKKILYWASVGDSRIYIVNRNGATQITRDEGYGNAIDNALGVKAPEFKNPAKQGGEIRLRDGDRVVVCSDGITGDFAPDLISEREIWEIVNSASNAKDAAENLIRGAKKYDDRSAIVVQV